MSNSLLNTLPTWLWVVLVTLAILAYLRLAMWIGRRLKEIQQVEQEVRRHD